MAKLSQSTEITKKMTAEEKEELPKAETLMNTAQLIHALQVKLECMELESEKHQKVLEHLIKEVKAAHENTKKLTADFQLLQKRVGL